MTTAVLLGRENPASVFLRHDSQGEQMPAAWVTLLCGWGSCV